MDEPVVHFWRNRWFRVSALAIGGVAVASVLIGFVWLPSRQGDFSADGLWSSICRAAGVPKEWGGRQDANAPAERTTAVVLNRSMTRAAGDEAIGLGATIALQCTICHGVRGLTDSDAPNLAGQHAEVIVKQLADYRSGDRTNAVMQAFATRLTLAESREVAAYYAYLPRASIPETDAEIPIPVLVRSGDAMRNIAPCASCHGGEDYKLGAPRLQAMPKDYLRSQLAAFASGKRRNDSHGQMRNMARQLSAREIDELANYYARR